MSTTALDLFSDALLDIGQLGIGQSISPEQSQQALRYANRILQTWSTQRAFLYNVTVRNFALTAGTQDYTLGPTGTLSGARPMFVESAQIALPGGQLFLPLSILDKTKWGAIRDKGATSSANGLPQDLWPEYSYPNMGLHLWTVPGNSCQLALSTWELLQQFATIYDVISLPPGYEDPLKTTLSMMLAASYDMPIGQGLAMALQTSVASIQSLNVKSLGGALGEAQILSSPTLGQPQQAAPPEGR